MKLSKVIILHLLPGAITIVLIVLLTPFMQKYEFHTGLSFLIAFLFITIPIHLYLMLREGKRLNGFITFKNVNRYQKVMPVWQYVVFFLLFIIWAFGLAYFLSPLKEYFSETVFAWLPQYLKDGGGIQKLGYQTMLFYFILQILVDGIIIPIVEEFYFKGYLLSRMTSYGAFAPLLTSALFTLAHFWQPYNYLLIFLIQLPLTYLIWWKKNVYIGIYLHVFGNLFGATVSLISFLNNG